MSCGSIVSRARRFADGNVKTTYSDLKPQPNGALLASSDPVHVTALHMTSRQQPSVAHYTGNVRLWQTANVVRAPMIDFDQQNRTIVAHADTAQSVSSLFVQQGQDGKLSPVDVTADKLTYVDSERRAHYYRQRPGQEHRWHHQRRSRSMFT